MASIPIRKACKYCGRPLQRVDTNWPPYNNPLRRPDPAIICHHCDRATTNRDGNVPKP